MSPEVVIHATLEGEEEVKRGFRRMGEASESFSRQLKGLARDIASLGASTVAVAKLSEQFGILSEEQANVIREMGSMTALFGTVIRGLITLSESSRMVALAEHARGVAHAFADAMAAGITKIVGGVVSALGAIASSSIIVTIAEKARAVAHAIANAVSSLGLAVPVMIAAAAAAAVGIAAYTGAIKLPSLQTGGYVKETGIYLLHKGEYVIPKGSSTAITINVYGTSSPRETSDAIIDALRRSGVV